MDGHPNDSTPRRRGARALKRRAANPRKVNMILDGEVALWLELHCVVTRLTFGQVVGPLLRSYLERTGQGRVFLDSPPRIADSSDAA